MKVKKTYYYKGNKLYNVRKIKGLNYNFCDLTVEWKDKDDNNKEKLGNFYLKDLIVENYEIKTEKREA